MTPRELLISGAEELGIVLTVDQVNALFRYLAELNKWNRKINLTAITEEREAVIKHVLDSLSYLEGFTPGPEMRLLDMGSGSGFPALPVKIAQPGIMVTLVESVKKKASFLRHIIRSLGLTGAEVIDKRTEELSSDCHASYDLVTARAFADMKSALSAGSVFLKPGGLMVLSRGPEESISERDMVHSGVVLERKIGLVLPHSEYKRAVWVFKKHPCS